MVAGSNIPPTTALGPVQVPPASGAPVNAAKSEAAGLLTQSVMSPSMPALGGATSVTVTVELTLTQGGGTSIVYV